jgi:hypothetical protein
MSSSEEQLALCELDWSRITAGVSFTAGGRGTAPRKVESGIGAQRIDQPDALPHGADWQQFNMSKRTTRG